MVAITVFLLLSFVLVPVSLVIGAVIGLSIRAVRTAARIWRHRRLQAAY
jgi:hypothetical protein